MCERVGATAVCVVCVRPIKEEMCRAHTDVASTRHARERPARGAAGCLILIVFL